MMSDQIINYYKEIWQWRAVGSTVWTVLLLPVWTSLYLLIVCCDVFHPFVWISDCLWSVFSISLWLHIVLLAVTLSVLAFLTSSHYTVKPQVLTSRWAALWNIVCPKHLGQFAAFSIAGAIASWSCINIERHGYVGLTKPCTENRELTCLNEHHLFMVLHGFFLGVMATSCFYLNNEGYLSFPTIQQSKYFHVKSKLIGLLYRSGVTVIKRMRYFYILYYFLGNVPKAWIVQSLELSESEMALDSVRGLLDWGLLWHVWLSGTFILFAFNLSSLLFKVYQTEAHQFLVEGEFDEKSSICLHNALACGKLPVVKYMAFQDLSILSQYHTQRRQHLFSLSQPGGHPHNWNSISMECLATIDNLTNSLVAHNNSIIANGSTVRKLSGENCMPPVKESKPHTIGTMQSASADSAFLKQQSPIYSSLLSSIRTHLKKRALVAFLVSDLPDTMSRQLFADSQIHVWAVEALSHLMVASYTEDKFGVVQKSMTDILTVMLNLLDALDKHFILATNIARRPPRGHDHSSDVTLRFAVRSALKSALYRIVTRFDKHLEFLSLSPEHKRRLAMFLDLKE